MAGITLYLIEPLGAQEGPASSVGRMPPAPALVPPTQLTRLVPPLECDLPPLVQRPLKLTFERLPTQVIPDDQELKQLPCTQVENYGCLHWELIYGDVDCKEPTFKHELPSATFVTQIFIHRREWRGFWPGIPACDFSTPTFGGAEVHECAHRSGLEAEAEKLWTKFKEEVDRLNATKCGINCACRDPDIRTAKKALEDALTKYEKEQSEQDAIEAEWAYYQRIGCRR